jgi:hypothetical protein
MNRRGLLTGIVAASVAVVPSGVAAADEITRLRARMARLLGGRSFDIERAPSGAEADWHIDCHHENDRNHILFSLTNSDLALDDKALIDRIIGPGLRMMDKHASAQANISLPK